MSKDENESEGALNGVTIVDLSRVLGGPFCTQILADHGAEVIKVEPPMGDETREWGPPFKTDDNGNIVNSAYFMGTNRNKRDLALDLRKPEAKDVLFRLLQDADVLVENFKVGTLEKWGLGYDDTLSEKFPRLIHCRITGFGADGPLGKFPGYDAVAQAMTGLISITGSEEAGPVRMGSPIVDLATGMNAAIGILMALFEREQSGRGQMVDATLFDTGVSLLHPHSANWFLSGKLSKLSGNAHPNISPYDLFPTKTRDVFLGIGNDRQFALATKLLGKPELARDERFLTNARRHENRNALREELVTLLASWDGDDLAKALLELGVPAGPANTVEQVLTDAHTLHRGMVQEHDDYRGVGPAVKLSRNRPSTRRAPPQFAEHNREILLEIGYSEAEIDRLVQAGAVVAERRKL